MDGSGRKRGRLAHVAVGLALATLVQTLVCAAAIAQGWAGANPSSNFAPSPLPAACYVSPQGKACINAGVYYLDRARARLHQRAYKLPASFVKLAPDRQALILTNLDRSRYGLPPVGGLTQALDRDAFGGLPTDRLGVYGDGDPIPSNPLAFTGFTSNWAGGFPNIVVAYEAWMYDDGPGSGNLDCPSAGAPGCWGHRHDVLWRFTSGGRTAMGAAAGKDSHGSPGYAMILAQGASSYYPSYTYTWTQARAAGAGRHKYAVHRPSSSATAGVKIGNIKLSSSGLVVSINAPAGVPLQCSLSHWVLGQWVVLVPFHSCTTLVDFPGLAAGKYLVRVKSAIGSASAMFSF